MNIRLALLACALATAFTAPLAAEERGDSGAWLQWRGPNRAGLSDSRGLLPSWQDTEPKLVWQVEGAGKGFAGVSLANGVIYTTGNFPDGQAVVAFNAKNGEVVWKTPLTDEPPKHGYSGTRCTPSVDGNRLYVITTNGAIACLTTAGKIVWQRDFNTEWDGRMMSGWGFSESPLVDGPWVLCTPGGKDALMVALDKKTGKTVWQAATPEYEKGARGRDGAGYSSIVISHGAGVKQYVQLTGRGVVGVRARDGQVLWTYNPVANSTANIPTPIAFDDYIFASTGYGAGAALLHLVRDGSGPKAGVKAEEQYFLKGSTFQNHHGGMLLLGKHLFAGHGHNNGFPVCLDIETGELAWGKPKRGPGSGSAAVAYADGHLIFRYQSGELALVEATPDAYRLQGVFKPAFQQGKSWAHPVIVDGRLYLREQNVLMCYDLTGSR